MTIKKNIFFIISDFLIFLLEVPIILTLNGLITKKVYSDIIVFIFMLGFFVVLLVSYDILSNKCYKCTLLDDKVEINKYFNKKNTILLKDIKKIKIEERVHIYYVGQRGDAYKTYILTNEKDKTLIEFKDDERFNNLEEFIQKIQEKIDMK